MALMSYETVTLTMPKLHPIGLMSALSSPQVVLQDCAFVLFVHMHHS